MATLFRVLYDFAAEEEGELNAREGQIVALSDSQDAAADGWTLVYIAGEPERAGYVPSNYLQPLPAAGAVAGAGPGSPGSPVSTVYPNHSASQFSSPVGGAAGGGPAGMDPVVARLAALQAAGAGGLGGADMMGGSRYGPFVPSGAASFIGGPAGGGPLLTPYGGAGGPGAGAGGAGGGLSAADEFGQLFASHEEWFRTASRKRAEQYSALSTEAGELLRSVQESEARSSAVLARLSELESLVAREKARWAGLDAAPSSGVASSMAPPGAVPPPAPPAGAAASL